MSTRRDRLACRLANLVFRVVATKHYRDFLAGAIQYGLDAAARDVREGRDTPGDWRRTAV